jgi:hypothetical protein
MAKLNLALAGEDRAAVIERLKTRSAVRELAAIMRRLAPALVEARAPPPIPRARSQTKIVQGWPKLRDLAQHFD